jgi:hypothetical protein
MTGVCCKFDPDASRWIVRLENGEQKSLKPDNLEWVIAQEGDVVDDDDDDEDDSSDENGGDENAGDFARMASDQESGFVCCESFASAQKALQKKEARLEFGGVVDAEERAICLDLIIEVLAASTRQLRGISFVGCALSAADISRLATALRSGVGPQVAALGVSKNPGVDKAAWTELFEAVPPKAIWLDFGDNKLTDDAIAPLIAGLEGREELDKLYLDGNCLCMLNELCTALPDTGVTQLDLGDNAVDDSGAEMVALALPRSVVTVLVLGSNPITKCGAKTLFEVLPRSSLDTLYLDSTGVDDECLHELGGVLKDAKLSELHLDKTKITDEGVRGLIQHIPTTELAYLDISGNDISDEVIKMLESTVSVQREGEVLRDEVPEEQTSRQVPQFCEPCI